MPNGNDQLNGRVERAFLVQLRHHLEGLRAKIAGDFSKGNFEAELANLKRDPVYPKFAFDRPEYVLVRLMGRVSISIGRRLGEIYNAMPRFAAAARYNLRADQVCVKCGDLELDVCIELNSLSAADREHVLKAVAERPEIGDLGGGLGIEIRYNFNPNDSSRLRKDVLMADNVRAAKLTPVYLIFSAISPRDEAIARLTRAGWKFLVGEKAIRFAHDLLGMDLVTILDKPAIKAEVDKEVNEIMASLIASHAFQAVAAKAK